MGKVLGLEVIYLILKTPCALKVLDHTSCIQLSFIEGAI